MVAADNALTEAIERVLAAYSGPGEPWMLAEYVVVTAQQRIDSDGDEDY